MAQETRIKPLYRDPKHAIFGGVCAGIAEVLDVDALLARVTAFVAFVMTFGLAALLYLMLWALLPVKKVTESGIVEVEPRHVRSERYSKVVTVRSGHARFEKPVLKVAEQERSRSRRSDKPKKDLGPYRFALFLFFSSILLVTLVVSFAASLSPDAGFVAYAPLYFIPLSIFLMALPHPTHAVIIRVCIMILCLEACMTFFPFTLGPLDPESLGFLEPAAFVTWTIALIFLVAALVFDSATCYLFAVVTIFMAMIVSFYDLGFFDPMLVFSSSGFQR